MPFGHTVRRLEWRAAPARSNPTGPSSSLHTLLTVLPAVPAPLCQIVIGANKEAIIAEKRCTARLGQTAVVGYSGGWRGWGWRAICVVRVEGLLLATSCCSAQAVLLPSPPTLMPSLPCCRVQALGHPTPPMPITINVAHHPTPPHLTLLPTSSPQPQSPSSPPTSPTLSPSGPRCRRRGPRNGRRCLAPTGRVRGGRRRVGGAAV